VIDRRKSIFTEKNNTFFDWIFGIVGQSCIFVFHFNS
jgi:hypothetical protein